MSQEIHLAFRNSAQIGKFKKFKVRVVSAKRLVLEIAKRNIKKIFMVPNSNVKTYFGVIITLRSLTNTSPGHRQFCLYADVIKHGAWVQFTKTYFSPKF